MSRDAWERAIADLEDGLRRSHDALEAGEPATALPEVDDELGPLPPELANRVRGVLDACAALEERLLVHAEALAAEREALERRHRMGNADDGTTRHAGTVLDLHA